MSNTAQEDSRGGAGLEDRMRDLIIKNSQASKMDIAQPLPASTSALPPHMIGASDADQREYLSRQSNLAKNTDAPGPAQQQSPGGRKRPNQAQRRQMNAQLSVPVDTRPIIEAPVTGRGFSTSTGFPPTSSGFSRGHRASGHSYQHNHAHSNDFQTQNPSHVVPHRQETQYQQNQPHSSSHQWQGEQYRGQAQRFTGHINSGSHFATQQHIVAPGQYATRPQPQGRQLYHPGPSGSHRGFPISVTPGQLAAQSAFVQNLVNEVVSAVGIESQEVAEKEEFRVAVEKACRDSIFSHEQEQGNDKFDPLSVQLKCFGSMASGFATKASDMDLALLSPQSQPSLDSSDSALPRLLEKKLLSMGFGARLLTRTRVPIIKLCQNPTERLRCDLLEERLRWENGFTAGNNDDIGNTAPVVEETNADAEEPCNNAEQAADKNDSISVKRPKKTREERLVSFQQKLEVSLGDYYGAAKRLLRDCGGRDVGTAYVTLLSISEIKILTEVSKAFVNGLANENLKKRLLSYASLTFEQNEDPQRVRALSGIFTQIEGEHLAMASKDRKLLEKTTEPQYGLALKEWQLLMNQTNSSTMHYNRLLYQSLERLKKYPSLQLLFLEQYDFEDAIQYSARVKTMMAELVNPSPTVQSLSSIVSTHYVTGIKNAHFREKLTASISVDKEISFSDIVLQHRALELAHDYEKGLSKGFFKDEDQGHVEAYITLLQNRVSGVSSGELNASIITLLTKIRSLPDPTTIHKHRDRYSDHLEYPKVGVGIQCDINFSADLALHNTLLLRCYSVTDPRVIPLIIFIKHWAKRRGINTAYRGTLSSYGYVLMVLHYLTNIVSPFVCPNLQHLYRPPSSNLPLSELTAEMTCQGRDVRFWRNENEIIDLARRGMLNHNHDSIGSLACGFFEYFAHSGSLSTCNTTGFDWGREVLSLRTQGGLVTKQSKGWVSARTVTETTTESAPAPLAPIPLSSTTSSTPVETISPLSFPVEPPTPRKLVTKAETKEIRHRYLFAIEDPFETDHNVARTVTHNGIVSIRDEFRRAWRIIKSTGMSNEGGLLDEIAAKVDDKKFGATETMRAIFGWEGDEKGQIEGKEGTPFGGGMEKVK